MSLDQVEGAGYAASSVAPPILSARVLVTPGEIEALAPEWQALEAVAPGATVFQGHAWCARIAGIRGADGMAICAAYDRRTLIALLPLRMVQSLSGRIATGFGEPFQQYSEMLLAPGYRPADVLAAMLGSLRAAIRPDAVIVRKVRADSVLQQAIDGLDRSPIAPRFMPSGHAEGAPYVDLAPHPTFTDFHKTVSHKSRKNIRNARNRIARHGDLVATAYDSGPGLAAVIAGSHAGRQDWLDREGQVSSAFLDPHFAAFLAGLSQPETTGLDLLAVTLTTGDTPIAYQWGFVHRGRYYAYIASWAAEFEEFSPGKLIMEDVLRACHERGIAVADFLMPAARYKFTWATDAVAVRDWSAPLTARGHAITAWTTRLRPALKQAYLRMPQGVRGILRRVLVRGAAPAGA